MFLILVQLDLPSNAKIQGGQLEGPYKAWQLHFHWGKDGGPGSEHTIDGEQFPMEVTVINQCGFTLKCIGLGYKMSLLHIALCISIDLCVLTSIADAHRAYKGRI